MFFNDETSGVTTTEQVAMYATFNYQGTVKEHCVGIIPISKLNAPNIMKALIKFFGEINIPITQACFSCMDNTNVNSGSCGNLKRYILHKILMGSLWQSQIGIMFQALAEIIPMCC